MIARARRLTAAAMWLGYAWASPQASAEPSACPASNINEIIEWIPNANQFVLTGNLMLPLIALWPVTAQMALEIDPDSAIIFTLPGRTLLVALTHNGCVVGAYETDRDSVWNGLRLAVGPAL